MLASDAAPIWWPMDEKEARYVSQFLIRFVFTQITHAPLTRTLPAGKFSVSAKRQALLLILSLLLLLLF